MNYSLFKSYILFLILLALPLITIAGTQTVDNTGDVNDGNFSAGQYTLREAIANATAGDLIDFNLGGAGPYTITLGSTLTISTHSLTIDGFSESGYSVNTSTLTTGTALDPVYMVVIANATTVRTAFTITANYTTIKGLVLQDFGDGVYSGSDVTVSISGNNNQIQGCYIGMDRTGVNQGTKPYIGIEITSADNTIGSGDAAGVNLISGMNGSGYGIYISGASATGNVIKGNMIGLQDDGATIVASADQDYGIYIDNATLNTIGGTGPLDGNIISGNNSNGIYIINSTAGNFIYGNFIGPRSDGATYVASNPQQSGIKIDGSPDNIIGGSTSGHRNIISANESDGIYITAAGATGTIIQGNYIGPDKNGVNFIASSSQNFGVRLLVTCSYTTVGGSNSGEGNVISGNQYDAGPTPKPAGIFMHNSTNNVIKSNIIGLQADGTSLLTGVGVDQKNGIQIASNGSTNNTIGGTSATERNIISGNTSVGISFSTSTGIGTVGPLNNTIIGNYIGIASDGISSPGAHTQDKGISMSAGNANIIGGTTAGERNVIADNVTTGIHFATAVYSNTIIGNYIGTQKNGSSYVSTNQDNGISLSGKDNIVGGSTVESRNIISGNDVNGILVTGSATTGNLIKGNYIGLGTDGVTVIGTATQDYGIQVASSAKNNTIGGANAGEGNLISGNDNSAGGSTGAGIYLNAGVGVGNTIKGNIIGPVYSGTAVVSGTNKQDCGIYINGDDLNTIGGTTSIERNIISGNLTYGVYLTGAAASANTIKGNYIGLGTDGTTFIASSSQDNGVYLTSSAASNTIGGTTADDRNIISGNTVSGIYVDGGSNTIKGNFIGTDKLGGTAVSTNQTSGITISGGTNNVIGGTANTDRNIISGNTTNGIDYNSTTATDIAIKGNYIGLASDGSSLVASNSQDYGIYVTASPAGGITIGGTVANEGNTISGNTNAGVAIPAANGAVTLLGNIIGPRSDGTTFVTSNPQQSGIEINGSPDNIIGGSTSGHRNIISANESEGIHITAAGATGTIIQGNYIGPDKNGVNFIASSSQNYGVRMIVTSSYTTVGGSNSGEGNVISGNQYDAGPTPKPAAVYMFNSTNNVIKGNIIGLQADGVSLLAGLGVDQRNGIQIAANSSTNNTIGGTSATERNIISGNTSAGISFSTATGVGTVGPLNNTIIGNYIGIASDGISSPGAHTQDKGISMSAGNANIIGGTTAGERNIIADNVTTGIHFATGVYSNTIIGNYIGIGEDGSSYVSANQDNGISLSGKDNIVGGSTVESRNIISGNDVNGILVTGSATTGNLIQGNYLGLGTDGVTVIGSATQDYGIQVASSAKNNTIGGANAGEGNVISGNDNSAGGSTGAGIYLNAGVGVGNTIKGNIIGPVYSGTAVVSGTNKQDCGIYINGDDLNTIGGTTSIERNIISGNLTYGVYLTGAAASANTIKGNYIGLGTDGTTFIASSSQDNGVYLTSSAASNTIGGTTADDRNIISGNTVSGIYVDGGSNTIKGNFIGTDKLGGTAVSTNQTSGITIAGGTNNVIGGTANTDRNIISGNTTNGIDYNSATATGIAIKGNYIGLASNGSTVIGSNSQDNGIYIAVSPAGGITIGGTASGDGNNISGNTNSGIKISSVNGSVSILGNVIGPRGNAVEYVASNTQLYGVHITGSDNVIGGSVAGAKNIISANETAGVYITTSTSSGNIIKGNYIGPASDGSSIASANQDYGVYLINSTLSNQIGGYSTSSDGNTISYNTTDGIYLIEGISMPPGTVYNLISRNFIYSNTSKGINLNYGVNQGNSGKAAPNITSITATTVGGDNASTAGVGDSVEVFKNSSGACDDAPTYLGTTKADNAGNWTLSGITLNTGETAVATARTLSNNNTSEFGTCLVGLPIELLSFNATAIGNKFVRLDWITASETNNDFFTIEKTQDGKDFYQVTTIDGAGHSNQLLSYSTDDHSPFMGISYYRLKQTDFDGKFEYSDLVPVDFNENKSELNIFPNPANGNDISFTFYGQKGQDVSIIIRDILGKIFYSQTLTMDSDMMTISISERLASGIYTITAFTNGKVLNKKIIID